MKIVITAFLDDLYALLAEVSVLVSLYEKKEISFVSSLGSWMEKAESLLEKNRCAQVGEIAGLRAQLLSASNGVYDRNFFIVTPSGGKRKILQAAAGILLNNAQNVLKGIFNTYSTLKQEAEKYMRQIVLISLQKNTFYPVWSSDGTTAERLIRLWNSFIADKDLVVGARQILACVNYADALRILDEVITDWKL